MPTSLGELPDEAPGESLGALLPEIRGLGGPRAEALVDALARTECPALTARRARRRETSGADQDPVVWAEARGANVVDVDGNRFVDMTAGFGVAALGHGHPAVREAVIRQTDRMLHALGDVHPADVKIALLSRLAAMVPIEDPRFVLGSHGADAVEAALQTALLFTGKPGVVAFEGGYHGLSLGALSVCGYKLGFRAPFAAKLDGHVRFVPYPRTPSEAAASLSRLEAELARGDVGAVLIEPVLGRGGVFVPPEGALASIAARARAAGALLIADEIWTGLGRTGVQWASEEAGMRPDILCLGKALGGGLPISACAARREVMAAWGAPTGEAIRTATFLGHPLACAAALAHLDALEARDAPRLAREHGAILQSALEARLGGRFPIRGRAMALAIELGSMGRTFGVMRALLERGWITLPAGPDATALQLSPPLDLPEALADAFAEALAGSLS